MTRPEGEGEWRRFGLGSVALPEALVPHILTQMGWDSESVPYPHLVRFFEEAVQEALMRVELVDPDPDIAEAIETGSWYSTGIPEKPVITAIID